MHLWGRPLMTLCVLIIPISASAQTSHATTTSTEPSAWLASGFVGPNFGNNAKPASTGFGATIGHVLKKHYAAEVELSVTPDFQLQNNFFGYGVKPMVNTYMANAIWTRPMGTEKQVQPYISGGVGALSLRSSLDTNGGAVDVSKTRFGGDVGGGVMILFGTVGVKAGVRYYRATGSYNNNTYAPTSSGTNPGTTPSVNPGPGPYGSPASTAATASIAASPVNIDAPTATALTTSALSGLHYWRFNTGVVLRW